MEQATRDARYTSTGKVPVYIILQKVRYHIFAQFGISNAAVAKCTCKWQCFPNCCATSKSDNRIMRWIKQMKLSAHLKLINKENSRSEIWHYFGYKTDERTDLTTPVCKRCYKSPNLFKHLSLAHPDLFRELRDRQVSASFINSDFI